MTYKADDISLLLPSFQPIVEKVLRLVTAAGYKPVLKDGWRSLSEAEANAKRGTGIVSSMHCYGCAADVICSDHGWDCDAHKCDFYRALGAAAVAAGAVWGGNWPNKPDRPHFQAVLVSQQNLMRCLTTAPESALARDLVVQHYLGRTSLKIALLQLLEKGELTKEGLWVLRAYQYQSGLKVTGLMNPETRKRLEAIERPLPRTPSRF